MERYWNVGDSKVTDTPKLPVPVETLPALRPVAERVADLFRHAKAEGTWRAYSTDWSKFAKWCAEQDRLLFPFPATAEVLVAYLADPAVKLKVASMQRRLAALACRHELAGHPPRRPTPG